MFKNKKIAVVVKTEEQFTKFINRRKDDGNEYFSIIPSKLYPNLDYTIMILDEIQTDIAYLKYTS